MRQTAIGLVVLALAGLAAFPASAQERPTAPSSDLMRMVLHDPDDPVGGNPRGDVTIVAFLDYNCPFCRRSTPQLDAFMASDPNVRVVYKDWPILSEESVVEAKVAIAANYQGKYHEAHDALIAITMRPATKEAVRAALKGAGLDIDRLNADLSTHNDEIEALLKRHIGEADALGLQGTPVFLIVPFKMAQELDAAGFRQVVVDARMQAQNVARRAKHP